MLPSHTLRCFHKLIRFIDVDYFLRLVQGEGASETKVFFSENHFPFDTLPKFNSKLAPEKLPALPQ